jgi:hypothetical protein
LVARTGTPWEAPTGPEAYPVRRELRIVGNHALQEVWEDDLALKLHALLDSMDVKWTSTDVVRIRDVEESFAPVILWIGVIPASLSGNDGIIVASKCRELLVEYNIADVNVEIRESVVTHSVGPKLLTPAKTSNPTVDAREPVTTTLGLPICAESTPWAEGTGGFFITEGGSTERLLLVTARHVVFNPGENENKHFEHKGGSKCRNVMLFGNTAFNKYLESIKAEIEGKEIMAKHHLRSIGTIERKGGPTANENRRKVQDELYKARKAIEELDVLYRDILTHWTTPETRILGHIILSPPISVGVGSSGSYTEDWAVIEVDTSKVDTSNFGGNAIDLGTRIPFVKFIRMVCPNRQDTYPYNYPLDRLLRVKDIMPDEEMRHLTALDEDNDPCLMAIKRGNTTGLTVGRANNIFSYARIYYNDNKTETSKEWAILPLDSKSGPFSAKGDSGSVIVDRLGRIGGLLTGGAGATSSLDITYATPISFLLKRMQENGLHEPNINPALATDSQNPLNAEIYFPDLSL